MPQKLRPQGRPLFARLGAYAATSMMCACTLDAQGPPTSTQGGQSALSGSGSQAGESTPRLEQVVERGQRYGIWSLENGEPFVALGLDRKRVSCALDGEGKAYCWGRVKKIPEGRYVAIDGGDGFGCALSAAGNIDCVPFDGQPGGGELEPPTGAFVQLSLGFLSGCAINEAARAVCWAGVEQQEHLTVPDGKFTRVATGDTVVCALTDAGDLACWGSSPEEGSLPSRTAGPFSSAVAHGNRVCALDLNQQARCFPELALPLEGSFEQVALGSDFVCGLTAAGRIECSTQADGSSMVPPLGTFTAVDSGNDWACALRVDGKVVCWGSDFYGQSGSGTLD